MCGEVRGRTHQIVEMLSTQDRTGRETIRENPGRRTFIFCVISSFLRDIVIVLLKERMFSGSNEVIFCVVVSNGLPVRWVVALKYGGLLGNTSVA